MDISFVKTIFFKNSYDFEKTKSLICEHVYKIIFFIWRFSNMKELILELMNCYNLIIWSS